MLYKSELQVTVPASSRALLTIEECRAAVGLAPGDTSRDIELLAMEERVAAELAAVCRIRRGGLAEPTFREETLTETITADSHFWYTGGALSNRISVSRVPLVSVVSITEWNTILTPAEYEIEQQAGLIRRLDPGTFWPCFWLPARVVIVYVAGWATVPVALKNAAGRVMQYLNLEAGTDRNLRRKSTDGVASYEWFDRTQRTSIVPEEVSSTLEAGGFAQQWVV